ncbi:hypothetical protein BH11ACT8_BH11ACT8_12580 [soil metagenome]
MTERSAPPPPPTAPPVLPPPPDEAPKPSRKERRDAAKAAAPGAPAQSGGDSTAAPASGDTAVRAGFAETLRAKLAGSGDDSADPGATTSTKPVKAKARGPRRARLRLTRIDPWSVMKTAFLLSIAFGIVTVVSVAMIWQVLNSAGVWDSINSTIRDVLDSQDTATFDVRDYVGTDRVLGFTMLVAAVDVVLLTAIATLGAFLYNMAAALRGGIEVTLAEDH